MKFFIVLFNLFFITINCFTQDVEIIGGIKADSINGSGGVLKNIANPVNPQDAATKAYVDALRNQIDLLNSILLDAGFNGTVQDADGNIYKTIKIGNQVWMAENLNTSKYNNGDPILYVGNDAAGDAIWASSTGGAYSLYENASNYEETYGKLYNWHAVNDARGICPDNWRVPTDDEIGGNSDIQILVDNLGPNAGGELKDTILMLWTEPNFAANNATGFSGLPGGLRYPDGSFEGINGYAFWWTSTPSGINAKYFSVAFNTSIVYRVFLEKNYGFSIRCIKDD